MFDFLKLKKEVSETTTDIEADDVLSVKRKLKELGHYQEPEWGLNAITDNGMFDGIRNFQKEKGLNVDGIMKPEGETEAKMNEALTQRKNSSNNSYGGDRDKEIRDRMYPIIKQHEFIKDYPYKDTKGNITVGLGSNIHDEQKFNTVKWQDQYGRPISKEDVNRHYQKLKSMLGSNLVADAYKDKTPLRISESETRRLYDEHLNNDLSYLREKFKDFDKFPTQLQNVLTDIKYNTGNVEEDKWPTLHKAISERSIKDILNNVHRKDVPQSRNDWAIEHLRQIKRLDY